MATNTHSSIGFARSEGSIGNQQSATGMTTDAASLRDYEKISFSWREVVVPSPGCSPPGTELRMSTPRPQADAPETAPAKPGILSSTFRAFHYHDFRLMWFGAFISTTGAIVQEVAQKLLIYRLTKSEFLLGLTAFFQGAPILLFSLLGGVVADRMDRRKLLLASQYTQMVPALVLAVLIWLDLISIWHIMVAALVTGLAQAFGGPAYQALIPSLVDREDMPNAIALISNQFNLARVVGGVVGGFASHTLGYATCFLLNGISFIAVIVSLYLIRVRFVPQKTEDSVLHSLKEGLLFVYRRHTILALVFVSMVAAFLAVPLDTQLPVFAIETYHLGEVGYGVMAAVFAAGAVVGALFVAWLGNAPSKGRTLLLMLGGLGIAILIFALSTNLAVGCLFLFLGGYALLALFALLMALVQLLAPEEMRGRIMSVYNTAFRGAMPLGNLVTGSLASRFGAPLVIALNGGVLALIAGWYLLRDKQVTRL